MYLHFQEILGLPWYSTGIYFLIIIIIIKFLQRIYIVYKIDFTIVQLLSIVYFIGQESITETTEYFKQTCYCYLRKLSSLVLSVQIVITVNSNEFTVITICTDNTRLVNFPNHNFRQYSMCDIYLPTVTGINIGLQGGDEEEAVVHRTLDGWKCASVR